MKTDQGGIPSRYACFQPAAGAHSRRDFVRLVGLGSLGLLTGRRLLAETLASSAEALRAPYYGALAELPVGAVQPRGWIQKWLERQAEGLTGHPENMAYPFDTCMYAGKIPPPAVKHGDIWWPYEQSGYFVDGATRLSRLTGDATTGGIRKANLGYVLGHSGPDHLGESTWGWPNTVIGRALMAEHSATGDPRVVQALSDAVTGPGAKPGRGSFLFEEALYLYGLTGEVRMMDFAQKAYDRCFLSDPRSFSHVDKIRGDKPLREHGVTAAEQLKLLPLMYSYSGDPRSLELANLAYRKVEQDSLMPDGGMVSSEALGTTAFNSLHESCDLTDWSWSVGYLLMAGGEGHWADLIERTTFNALPGAVTKDFKQVQYFSAANQMLASNTASPRIAPTRMSYRAAHDTECCAGNINRAMPNYVIRMWMRTKEGLAATLYGPSELTTKVKGTAVSITQETDYPFRDSITFRIRTAQPVAFRLALRIPEWCTAASVSVNGKDASVPCPAGNFATLQREHRDGDVILLRLPMGVKCDEWLGGRAVSVTRGPLVYALPISEKRVESETDPEPIQKILKGNNIQGFPAVEFFPIGEWRYGLDAGQKAALGQFKVVESAMPENPFLADTTPVRIETSLRELPQWESAWTPVMDPPPADLKQAPKNPSALPGEAELQAAGSARTVTLVPYGATYLRLTTIPVIPA
jgi:hypothetical protein